MQDRRADDDVAAEELDQVAPTLSHRRSRRGLARHALSRVATTMLARSPGPARPRARHGQNQDGTYVDYVRDESRRGERPKQSVD